MIKQIGYILKKNLILMIVITITCSLVFGVLALVADLSMPTYTDTVTIIQNLPPTLVLIPTIMLTILASAIPFMIFKYRYNQVENEYYHSLPLTKVQLLLSHLIAGILVAFLPFLIAYSIGVIIISVRADANFQLLGYLYLLLASIPFTIGLFSFTTFIISRAHRLVDSIVMLVLSSSVLALILFTPVLIVNPQNWFDSNFNPLFFIPQMALIFVSRQVEIYIWWLIAPEQYYFVAYIIFGIVAILSIVGLVLTANKETPDSAQNELTSWYGYQLLVPLLVVGGIMLSGLYHNAGLILLAVVILGICGYVLHTIQRRSLKIKPADYTLLASAIIIGTIIALVVHYVII